MRNIFINTAYPAEGLFALNLYVKGKKEVITLDDYLPFSGSNLVFNKKSALDGDFWAVIIEKAFAKLNGNYEIINWGW